MSGVLSEQQLQAIGDLDREHTACIAALKEALGKIATSVAANELAMTDEERAEEAYAKFEMCRRIARQALSI